MKMEIKEAGLNDVKSLAGIRAISWGTEDYWIQRITGYLSGELHPQQALPPRIIYLAFIDGEPAGLIAGHLTKRFNCEGELEWIDVIPAYQRKHIASDLLQLLAKWFINNQAYRICVDPGNDEARKFYKHNGATPLNQHWMVWEDISKLINL